MLVVSLYISRIKLRFVFNCLTKAKFFWLGEDKSVKIWYHMYFVSKAILIYHFNLFRYCRRVLQDIFVYLMKATTRSLR